LNNGLTREYNPPHAGTDRLHTFVVDPGDEFTGFYIEDDWDTNC